MSENNMTKSQAKRKARQEASQKAKREAKRTKLTTNLIIALVVVLFAAGIGSYVYYRMTTTQASSDYSAYLNEDGTIKGVNPMDYITPIDYKNIVVPKSEIEYTEEDMTADINSLLSSNKTASTDAALTAAEGDTVNIDYVGTVDGVEFEGGSTGGTGTDLVLGSGSYVDDFEAQLYGSHPGDQVTVEVTFPEDYSSEDLQGKDAVFEVTVNSIYVLPDLTDEFVTEHVSDAASTVEEYKEYLKTSNEKTALENYLVNYINENAAAKTVNEGHLKYLKGITKYEQESYYNSYNQMMMAYTGAPVYNNFSEYTGMSNQEFESYLEEQCRLRAATDMTYQHIFTELGLTVEDDDYEATARAMGTNAFDTFGKRYIMQVTMQDMVISYLCENVTIQ